MPTSVEWMLNAPRDAEGRVTRAGCARLGGWLLPCAILISTLAAALLFEALATKATVEATTPYWIWKQMLRALCLAIPPAVLAGASFGVLRYQMKRGTLDEQKGGGGAFQVGAAMNLLGLHLPFLFTVAPLLTVIDHIFGTKLWGDGTSKWIAPSIGIATFIGSALLSLSALHEVVMPWACLGGMSAADFTLSNVILGWGDAGRLSREPEAELPRRYSLAAMMIFVIGGAAYATLVMYFFGASIRSYAAGLL